MISRAELTVMQAQHAWTAKSCCQPDHPCVKALLLDALAEAYALLASHTASISRCELASAKMERHMRLLRALVQDLISCHDSAELMACLPNCDVRRQAERVLIETDK